MGQKTILITGCSSGIGYDAAHGLVRHGWRVFATCRRPEDCARLQAEGLESFPLDLADEASVAEAVAQAHALAGGALDALFNNGAFAQPGAVEDMPRDALRAIFEVNLFGQFDLIRRVLPAMKAAGRGRIVNCSSVLGLVAAPMRGPYNGTKFAMEAMTDTLRLENRGGPVQFVLIEPGPITSRIRQNAVPHFERWIDWENSALRPLYENRLIPRLYGEKSGADRFELPASAVTRKLIRALEARRPRARYYVTTPTYVADLIRRFVPTALADRILAGN